MPSLPTQVPQDGERAIGNAGSQSPLFVINGTSLTSGGGRTILRQLMAAIAARTDTGWRVKVIARGSRDLPHAPHITYVAPPAAEGWLGRARLELVGLKRALRGEAVDTYLSMQGGNARLPARRKFIYCHNANGLNLPSIGDAIRSPRFALVSIFYGLTYRIGIGREPTIIVQQECLRKAFREAFGHPRIIVAHPVADLRSLRGSRYTPGTKIEAIYPTSDGLHKNLEVLCEAFEALSRRKPGQFVLTLTLSGDESRYARSLKRRFGHVRQLVFAGALSREALDQAYRRANLLVFPSRVESWGLPLSEAKQFGLGILAADLPYAHETVGDYDAADFFDPADTQALADRIHDLWSGDRPLRAVSWPLPLEPFAPSWAALVSTLLGDAQPRGATPG